MVVGAVVVVVVVGAAVVVVVVGAAVVVVDVVDVVVVVIGVIVKPHPVVLQVWGPAGMQMSFWLVSNRLLFGVIASAIVPDPVATALKVMLATLTTAGGTV